MAGRSTFIPAVRAALAGLGRTIASEHPELRLRQVDLADPITDMAALVSEILEGDNEVLVSLSAQHRYVARLDRHPRLRRAEVARRVRPDGAYLVTGGLGGLGLCTAQWLIGQGARHIVLMSRNRPSADVRITLERIRAHGINLTVHQADVTESQQVAHVLDEIRAGGMPLRGVFHAAGVLDDGILLNQSAERLLSVMAAKVDGSWILHELTIDQPLDFFVLYSSIASLLGSAGQGSHVAGNAFLDALAHSRRTEGLPATTINWGQWGEIGSAVQGDWTDRGISLRFRPKRVSRHWRRCWRWMRLWPGYWQSIGRHFLRSGGTAASRPSCFPVCGRNPRRLLYCLLPHGRPTPRILTEQCGRSSHRYSEFAVAAQAASIHRSPTPSGRRGPRLALGFAIDPPTEKSFRDRHSGIAADRWHDHVAIEPVDSGREIGLGEMPLAATKLLDASPAMAREPVNIDLDRPTDERVDDMLKELPQQCRGRE